MFEYLRHLMQHYEHLSFLFSLGSGLQEMEAAYAFLFNVSLYKRISFLEPQAARLLICQPVASYYDVEPAAVARILEVTSGHPYFTQLVCHSLFSRWQQSRSAQVRVDDVDAVLDEVVERGLAVLKQVWEDARPGGEGGHGGDRRSLAPGQSGPGSASDRARLAIRGRGLARRRVGSGRPEPNRARDPERRYRVCLHGRLQRLWVRNFKRVEWVERNPGHGLAGWAAIDASDPARSGPGHIQPHYLAPVAPKPCRDAWLAARATRAGRPGGGDLGPGQAGEREQSGSSSRCAGYGRGSEQPES